MFSYELLEVITRAIESKVSCPPGAMRPYPATEEEVALKILNALEEAGYRVVSREQQPSAPHPIRA